MASIRQRNSKWQARVIRKGFPSLVKSFETRREAQRWAAEVESTLGPGSTPARHGPTHSLLTEILQRYVQEVTPTKRGAVREAEGIRFMQRHSFTRHSMANLTPGVIAAYRDERLKKVGAGTVIRELCILSSAINHAIREWGVSISNPCSLVRKPATPRGRSRILRGDEEKRLLDALEPTGRRSKWMRPLVKLALETAMRRGELLGLHWDDIDFDRRVAVLGQTKNGQQRLVPLSSRAVEVLVALPRSEDGRVFPISAWTMEQAFRKARIRAGVPDLHFHDLRHNAATRMAAKLPNLIELAAVTGHRTVQMLKRYYHPQAEQLAAKLD